MLEDANKQLMAVTKRMEVDPALRDFVYTWAGATLKIIRWNPPEAHEFVLQQVLAQLVMDWDGIKDEFDGQFKTN
jgi:hypothetical protein